MYTIRNWGGGGRGFRTDQFGLVGNKRMPYVFSKCDTRTDYTRSSYLGVVPFSFSLKYEYRCDSQSEM